MVHLLKKVIYKIKNKSDKQTQQEKDILIEVRKILGKDDWKLSALNTVQRILLLNDMKHRIIDWTTVCTL